MNKLSLQKGFTLVEIAIVLVIIGLLLGGVLKGQELIKNSKINSVVQDFEGIKAAYYAYVDRTGEVPGLTPNGGGGSNYSDAEFWTDLRTENFIAIRSLKFLNQTSDFSQFALLAGGASTPGNTVFFGGAFIINIGVPTSAVTGPKHALNGNFFSSRSTAFFGAKSYICASNIDSDIATGIDVKLDDGLPGTGSVRTKVNVEVSTNINDMLPTAVVTGNYPNSSAAVVPSVLCMAL